MTWKTPPTPPTTTCQVLSCATCDKIHVCEFTALAMRVYNEWATTFQKHVQAILRDGGKDHVTSVTVTFIAEEDAVNRL